MRFMVRQRYLISSWNKVWGFRIIHQAQPPSTWNRWERKLSIWIWEMPRLILRLVVIQLMTQKRLDSNSKKTISHRPMILKEISTATSKLVRSNHWTHKTCRSGSCSPENWLKSKKSSIVWWERMTTRPNHWNLQPVRSLILDDPSRWCRVRTPYLESKWPVKKLHSFKT